MPEIDGWETTRMIHNLFSEKKIRVLPYIIAYSAFDSKEDINKCYDSGMCGHISKPCYKEEICSEINNWFNKSIRR